MKDISNDIEKILISENEIEAMVERISAEISLDYAEGGRFYDANKETKLLLVCILKGSVVFMGDLMKHITLPVEIDFMRAKSYVGTESSGEVQFPLDLTRPDIDTCDILIVEDIIDSGNTLMKTIQHLKDKGAHSVRTVTLLDKPSRRKKGLEDFEPDYYGCIIPNKFIVGYGLDYNERYRALPYIGILKPEVYAQ